MKRFLVAVGLLVATSGVSAIADLNYPWCAQYGGGGDGARNCGFSTYAQCMATVTGMGGFCEQNSTYVPIGPAPRAARTHHYRYSGQ